MKSSENYPVTAIGTLYQFYRSIVFLSAPIKEEIAKSIYERENSQHTLGNNILDDVKEIDNRIFDLLEKLGAIENLQAETIQNDYSNRFIPTDLMN